MVVLMKKFIFSLSVISSVILSSNANAVIIREDTFSLEQSEKYAKKITSTGEVFAQFNKNAGGEIGSSVLISPNHVLTAAHLVHAGIDIKNAMANFAPKGQDFGPSTTRVNCKVIVNPEHGMDKNGNCNGVDLAILEFPDPIVAHDVVKLYADPIKDNSQFYIAGYGYSGYNKTGATKNCDTRLMGTTRITSQDRQYLTHEFTPYKPFDGSRPTTFEIEEGMDPMQALLTLRDSGGPLLTKKPGEKIYSVAGIYHGMQVVPDMGIAIQQWIPIAPNIPWINSVINRKGPLKSADEKR